MRGRKLKNSSDITTFKVYHLICKLIDVLNLKQDLEKSQFVYKSVST